MNHRILSSAALAVAITLNLAPSAAARYSTPANPAPAKPAAGALDGLTLAFEENRGQANPDILYTARTASGSIAITNDSAIYLTPGGAMTMRFGAASSVTAGDLLPGKTNYLRGKDSSKWQIDVPSYDGVTLHEIATGIDLVFHGTSGRPEYDFIVAAGADPNAIELQMDGASSISVDDEGSLVLGAAGGNILHERPVAYQDIDGDRVEVATAYTLTGGSVRFSVGRYDRSKPLVIDPVLKYATYLGGNGDDRTNGATVDSGGNAIIVGSTLSTNFDIVNQLSGDQGGMDAFVTKLNSAGTAAIFSTYIGGSGTDDANDVAVDASGRIFVTGASASNELPTTNGYDENNNGLDAFLIVLNSSGSAVTYGTFIGGGNNDIGNAVAVDIHGNAYIAGEALDFSGIFNANFPTKSPSSLDPFQKNYGGGRSDAFVCKFDPDQSGNGSLVYSTLIGGSEGEGVEDIVVDDNERAYVCGYTESSDFDRLNAIENSYGGGPEDGFITKFNADGTTVFYSTFYGGSAIDECFGIALDKSAGDNRAVVVGHTTSTNITTQFALQSSKSGPEDMTIAKLTDSGTSYLFSTYFGGPGNDAAQAVTVDSVGQTYFTGFSNNTYPLLNPIPINGQTFSNGMTLTILSASNALVRSTCGSSGSGQGIGVDQSGDVVIGGTTSSTALFTTPGAFQPTFGGAPNDSFVVKFDLISDDTIGVYKPGTRQYQLRNFNTSGAADITVTFGISGDKPIVGDWDGNGTTTIGAYTPSTGTFSLRNSNSAGTADFTFVFGGPNLVPISGDWDGDGDDTIGVFDPATNSYFLKNSLAGGNADIQFSFGGGGQNALPIAGDWDGDGVDTIGFYLASNQTFFLRNANAGGNADLQFVFGPALAKPVAGDWNGDGIDTVGTFSRVSFHPQILTMRYALTNTNAAVPADITATFGVSGDLPIVGNWDGQ